MTSNTDNPTPHTRVEAQARLADIDDAIADIRTQIATADMRRQAGARIDPDWVHRARTALRHLRRERADVAASIAALRGSREGAGKDGYLLVQAQSIG